MSSSETATVEAEHLVGMPPVQSPPSQATTMTGPPPANTTPPKLYKLPAPVKTFPLPNFYPSNPVSLVYAAYKWMSHLLFTPNEPSVIYTGIWSPGSSSVHVVDLPSMRALWEQGFYGKGNFSRSEPEWMNRELARRGLRKGKVSIDVTEDRRVARQQKKWERARAEQEAIRKQREEEARLADEADKNMRENGMQVGESEDAWPAPVGPIELLRMPNSEAELETIIHANGHSHKMPNGKAANGHATTTLKPGHDLPNGVDEEESPVAYTNGAPREPGLKRQKSVRFSPVVDSTTFLLHDPPSPQHALLALKHPEQPVEIPPKTGVAAENGVAIDGEAEANDGEIVNREHLQLSPEEAFFLVFGLGALVVKDRDGDQPIKAEELFDRFRRYSYFPPRIGPTPRLGPDDPFLLQYAVYHHFRSLGWVPRAGHKFGVDWLLYMRGPVFDHAQFAVLVLPEYEDPEWRRLGRAEGTGKSWTWFFGVSRVISQVHKKLVLAYVCVPPPERFEEALGRGVAHALGMYKVREVMVARWSPNRNR